MVAAASAALAAAPVVGWAVHAGAAGAATGREAHAEAADGVVAHPGHVEVVGGPTVKAVLWLMWWTRQNWSYNEIFAFWTYPESGAQPRALDGTIGRPRQRLLHVHVTAAGSGSAATL